VVLAGHSSDTQVAAAAALREPVSLDTVHAPERRRVGFRRLFHVLRVHLNHPAAGRRLAHLAVDGDYRALPEPHTFGWRHPHSWTEPISAFTRRLSAPAAGHD
jgi:hypothetical protein